MKKSNMKTIIAFFSFVIGIGTYFAFLISNNHEQTGELGVVIYWYLILTRMTVITPDFYNQVSFVFLGGIYIALILSIGFIIIRKAKWQIRSTETGITVSPRKRVFGKTLKFISVKHPMYFYGIPGVSLLIAGIVFGYNFLDAYLVQNTLFLGSLFGSLILILIGVLLITTSIILFSMTNLWKEQK